MRISLLGPLAVLATLSSATTALATCPTFTTLANGNTADAGPVMDNFNYILNCPTFNGSIGIGTGGSTPGALIDMAGNSSSSATAISLRFIDQAANLAARNWILGNGAGSRYGDFAILVSSAHGGNPSGTTPVLDLGTNGYAGINTGAPAARLDITGTAATSPFDIGLKFTETSTSPNARNWLIAEGAFAYGDLSFLASSAPGGTPGGTPVLYISKSATVGINMSTAPTQALEVNGQIKVDSLASASSTSLCINAGVISSCSSSLRYKEDVRNANFGLNEVKDLRPVLFKWKGRDEQDFGLIAEEVAKVNPLFVTYKSGKIEGVKYPQLTAVLINAIKDLKLENDKQALAISLQLKKISAQEQEISALRDQQEARINRLDAQIAIIQRRLTLRTARAEMP